MPRLLALALVLSVFAPSALAQDAELQKLRDANDKLLRELKEATSAIASQGQAVGDLRRELKKQRALKFREVSHLRDGLNKAQDELIRQARAFDREKRRLADQQDDFNRKLTALTRDNALHLARGESAQAKLRDEIARLEGRLAWQLKLATGSNRCVSVSFEGTELREALAELARQSGIRHVLSQDAQREAATQTLTLKQAHVPLKTVLDEVARQTQLGWETKEGAIHVSGLTRTESGLRFKDLALGKGALPKPGQVLLVHYVGSFTSGEVFDHSKGKPPLEFSLGKGQVIKGFEEGIASMRIGGKRRLVIPPELAYGPKGTGPIPPSATLVFEVELVGVK